MSVLSDKSIRKLALEEAMISPFVDKQNGFRERNDFSL